ncbi:MAG: PAS domain-containing protein [Verrucomicrobia bacterium]|nr:PAS domain-containing protein [Verrucomicrobiota bacterium]
MSVLSHSQKTSSHEALNLTSALHDCLACGVLVVDSHGCLTACTPEATHLLQLPAGSVAQGSLSLLPEPLQAIIRKVVSTKAALTDQSVSLPPRSGSSTALHVSAVPVATAGSWQVVVVLNDISVARQLEENMRRLDRLASIGTLSASMGHEIKNALVAVKTFVDLLIEKSQDSELTDVVRREMRRIDAMVSQLLKFGAPAQPTFSALRLHEILNHSLRMVQHQLANKQINLQRKFNAAPDAIQGDNYQLEQAFVNLFLNAVEAMEAKGSLTVDTEIVAASATVATTAGTAGQPQLRVTITDTGIGVAAENLERLFEPFFTTKNHGTGLGLPITRRILQEHHGDISVQSRLNQGTSFIVLLPAGTRPH